MCLPDSVKMNTTDVGHCLKAVDPVAHPFDPCVCSVFSVFNLPNVALAD